MSAPMKNYRVIGRQRELEIIGLRQAEFVLRPEINDRLALPIQNPDANKNQTCRSQFHQPLELSRFVYNTQIRTRWLSSTDEYRGTGWGMFVKLTFKCFRLK
jgi:hypothetical protein